MFTSCIFFTIFFVQTLATTEWFGDLRAQLNPPKSPAFYDVTYDDIECPQGLQSNAIPDYVYFGAMIATMTVTEHTNCLERCVADKRCHAINFFEPMSYQEKGFCELLSETQLDNPRLMRPFRNATYYDNIRCRTDEEEDAIVITKPVGAVNEEEKKTETTVAPVDSHIPEAQESTDTTDAKVETTPQTLDQEKLTMAEIMKQLEAKVHEFNIRFRHRRST
uniref:Apple domain-containing protein n=1 Tax=Panagrolaimus sp. JU765 TaxID=591449 RepID=A0AC34REX2_9BILA